MAEKNKTDTQSIHKNIQEILRKLESFQIETRDNFARMDGRVDRISQHVAHIPQLETRLENLESEMKAVRVRLDNLEGLHQHLDKKLEILDHEYVSMTAALKRLEERFDDQEANQLKERVRILEEKVASLEKNTIN